jgi:hypothetical protein
MASTRRRPTTGFSAPELEIIETLEETPVNETVEKTVAIEEVETEVVEVKEETPAPVAPPSVFYPHNNPTPVALKTAPRRNTPRFSARG